MFEQEAGAYQDMRPLYFYFIEYTAAKAPVVRIFDASWLTTLQVAPPVPVADAFGVQ